jgi:pimeloyl-ACP methyl ester carboxylesterase
VTNKFDDLIKTMQPHRTFLDDECESMIGSGNDKLRDFCVLLVPGMFCSYVPFYFSEAMLRLKELGVECRYVHVHPHSSVGCNADLLLDNVLKAFNETKKPIILMGHSKGGVDASAMIAMYPQQTTDMVEGLITIQTPYLGSSLIPNINASCLNSYWFRKLFDKTPLSALLDLSPSSRKSFSQRYPMATNVTQNTLCFSSATSLSLFQSHENDGVVSRMETEIPGARVVRWQPEKSHFFLVTPPLFASRFYHRVPFKFKRRDGSDTSPSSGDIVEALLRLLLDK